MNIDVEPMHRSDVQGVGRNCPRCRSTPKHCKPAISCILGETGAAQAHRIWELEVFFEILWLLNERRQRQTRSIAERDLIDEDKTRPHTRLAGLLKAVKALMGLNFDSCSGAERIHFPALVPSKFDFGIFWVRRLKSWIKFQRGLFHARKHRLFSAERRCPSR